MVSIIVSLLFLSKYDFNNLALSKFDDTAFLSSYFLLFGFIEVIKESIFKPISFTETQEFQTIYLNY